MLDHRGGRARSAGQGSYISGNVKGDVATIVADRRVWNVWPNQYRVYLIRRAAKLTTLDNPVIVFPAEPKRKWRSFGERVADRLASVTVVENGRSQRVRLAREDDYRAT